MKFHFAIRRKPKKNPQEQIIHFLHVKLPIISKLEISSVILILQEIYITITSTAIIITHQTECQHIITFCHRCSVVILQKVVNHNLYSIIYVYDVHI
jgi:hypothetical protein